MVKYIELECACCGKKFLRELHKYKYCVKKGQTTYVCSKKCQVDIRRKEYVTIICKHCGKPFKVNPSRKDEASFCSIKCKGEYNALKKGYELKKKRVCKICGKEFLVKPNTLLSRSSNFCSRECYYKSKKANNKIKIFDDYVEIIVNSEKYGIHTVLVDKESLNKIGDYVIGVEKHHTGTFYARIYDRKNKKRTPLHRFLTNCPADFVVDHINHCPLDNRMSNLRVCTSKENSNNKLSDDVLKIVKEYYQMKYYYKDFETA